MKHSLWWLYALLVLVCLLPALNTGCDRKGTQGAKLPITKSGSSAPTVDDLEFQNRMNQALGLMGQYKFKDAHDLFARLSESRPDDLDLAVNTAISRLNMAGDKDLQTALVILDAVMVKEPRHLRANYCAGLLKTYLGPPADPLPHFRVANELDPDDADVVYLLAKGLEQAGELDAATTSYLRCLDLNEYYASAMLGLGRLARMKSEMEQAKSWLKQFESMKANPNCRVFEFAYKRMGKYGEVAAPTISANATNPRPLPKGNIFDAPREIVANRNSIPFAKSFGESKASAAITPVDLNHDGRIDLLIHVLGEAEGAGGLVSLINNGNGSYDVLDNNPWLEVTGIRAVLCGDVDQDGRVDLYLCRNGENQLWLQTAANQWQIVIDEIVGGGDFDTASGLLCDSDHDGDLDIICANTNGDCRIIANNRDGTWRVLETDQALSGPASWLAAGDFDNQRDLDLFVGGLDSAPKVLLNERLWRYRVDDTAPQEMLEPSTSSSVCLDVDDDGWLDLIQQKDGRFEIWSKQPQRVWKKKQTVTPVSTKLRTDATGFAVVDLKGDGSREFLVETEESIVVLDSTGKELERLTMPDGSLRGWSLAGIDSARGWSVIGIDDSGKIWEFPPGVGRYPFVAVGFTGKKRLAESMRSNRSGIGTRWKARTGTEWSTGTGFPLDSLPGQSYQPELIGLRGWEQVDFLAVDWSDGVFQTELALHSGTVRWIEETQRQLASCPLVFAWNGKKIEFVTDVLGVGGIGFMTAPGEYAPPRPWENLLLTESQLQPLEGRMVIKIGEPMEEACYLQSAKLVSVDVPEGWQIVIDERMGITDPQPTGDFCYFRSEQPIVAAHDRAGKDQVAALQRADGTPADVGELDHRFIGLLATEQALEFSFGEAVEFSGRPALVIDGWLEYPYSQTVFGAWQSGLGYDAPSLEVSHDGEHWDLAWDKFGYPAGMPRTMLLPLPEKAKGKLWFRFRSKMQIYWDRIRLVYLEECPDSREVPLQLIRAELRWSGFAKRSTRPWFNPWYDYSERSGTWDSRHLPGFYTRFGEITELVAGESGALTIFGPGEEVHLEYATAPALEAGSNRVHVLKLGGWCKDLDLYTDTGDSLGPLPDFLSGSAEPARSAELHQKYNWRYESGPWFQDSPDPEQSKLKDAEID